MAKEIYTNNTEREFDVSELFFSTTDKKGIITSCNEVFTRIAEYEPHEIIGQPHNIIRHPSMPRSVFYLLWEYLLSGRAIGAYVKNRTKSGAYYWVFALAMPIDEGFISIRLKPTSGALELVNPLYNQLTSLENNHKEDRRKGMQASYSMLHTELNKLGFRDYDEFMANALRTELGSRYRLLSNSQDNQVGGLQHAFNGLEDLNSLKVDLKQKNSFFESFATILFQNSLNLGVKASRLAESGRALRVICNDVANIANSVNEQCKVIVQENSSLSNEIEVSSFSISFATLLIEMLLFFQLEQKRLNIDENQQKLKFGKTFLELENLLSTNLKLSLDRAKKSQSQLGQVFSSFESFVVQLGKILLSIQFSYVTGKSLAATIAGSEGFSVQLSEIIAKADQARLDVDALSEQINKLNTDVKSWAL
jgi:PAS domain S-box-containing protein